MYAFFIRDMEKVDVAIVGGGIAGLTVAKFLSQEGIDFILFEEHDGFFKKACGEGIYLELGKYDFSDLYESKKGIERVIDSTLISTKYGEFELHIPVAMSDKKVVEEEIARQTIRNGGRIEMNSKVNDIVEYGNELMIEPQKVVSKIVVGADGVNSVVRKYMGIQRPHVGVAATGILSRLDKPPDHLYVEFKRSVIRHGYSWFFPKKEEWNIGIGTFTPEYFKQSFQKFKNRFSEVRKWRFSPIPVSKPLKSYGKNVILVGDAASQIFPATGNGILSSMVCAKIAADEIAKMAKSDFREIDLSKYERAWKKVLSRMFTSSYNYYRLTYIADISEFIFHELFKIGCKLYW